MGKYQREHRVEWRAYHTKYMRTWRENKVTIIEQQEKEVLNKMDFTYVNGYTLKAVNMHEAFKFEISGHNDEVAVLVPNDRVELMAKWLNLHLKGTD
jgi:hypothetical protein